MVDEVVERINEPLDEPYRFSEDRESRGTTGIDPSGIATSPCGQRRQDASPAPVACLAAVRRELRPDEDPLASAADDPSSRPVGSG